MLVKTVKTHVRDDAGGHFRHVVGPSISALLQLSGQTFLRLSLRGEAPIPIQEVPLWSSVPLAPVWLPRLVQRHGDQQRLLGTQPGLREVCVDAAVVRGHHGHKVLQEVVTGHHQDGYAEEGYVHHLEASRAPYLLQDVSESHTLAEIRPPNCQSTSELVVLRRSVQQNLSEKDESCQRYITQSSFTHKASYLMNLSAS